MKKKRANPRIREPGTWKRRPRDIATRIDPRDHTLWDLGEKLRMWRTSIVRFAEDVVPEFHEHMEPWQLNVLRNFQKRERSLCVASKGVGKSACAAICTMWFLTVHENANVMLSSITEAQLKNALFKEIKLWIDRSPFLSELFAYSAMRIYLRESPDTTFAVGMSYDFESDKTEQQHSLAGHHAEHIAYILDEAGSIPMAVLVAMEGVLTTGKVTRMFLIGNSTSRKGCLYKCAHDRPQAGYAVVRVTSDPQDPYRSRRVKPSYVKEMLETYGRDHPWTQVNIMAEFPDVEAMGLLSEAEVLEARRRKVDPESVLGFVPYLGIDPATGKGSDRTAVALRRGSLVFPVKLLKTRSVEDQVTEIMEYLRKHLWDGWARTRVFVDSTGGYSMALETFISEATSLRRRSLTMNAQAPRNPDRYQNMRAYLYARLADWVKRGGSLPEDDVRLQEELVAMEAVEDRDRLCLLPKKTLRATLGRSPDSADAVALTFAEDSRVTEKARHDFLVAAGISERAPYDHLARASRPYDYLGFHGIPGSGGRLRRRS